MTFPAERPSSGSSPEDGQPRSARALDIRTGPQFRLRVYWPNQPELRCPKCGDWYELTPQHWYLNEWSECRKCHSAHQALQEWLRRREEPGYRSRQNARVRGRRAALLAELRAQPRLHAAYLAQERERKARYLRGWRAAKRAA